MGDNFEEGQAKNTQKRRAKARANLAKPKLLLRPDKIVDEFTVECQAGTTLHPGEELRCFPTNENKVNVARQHQNVGVVGATGGCAALQEIIEHSGVGRLRVERFNELTETAQVVIVRQPDKTEGSADGP